MKIIAKCVENFYKNVLHIPLEKCRTRKRVYFASSIPLVCNDKEEIYYLFFEYPVIEEVGHKYFGEDMLDLKALDDLCREVANQIVGSAKVMMGERYKNNEYHLGTPEFLGEVLDISSIATNKRLAYKTQTNHTFVIAKGL